MPLHRFERPRARHPFVGMWHITAMERWYADYVNMERQAFVEVRPDNPGSFQFGLVSGELDGYLEGEPPRQRFAFTLSGNDEMDPAGGSGWIRPRGADEAVGLIKIHGGDRSRFRAPRAR
jgi:hypothetical protein